MNQNFAKHTFNLKVMHVTSVFSFMKDLGKDYYPFFPDEDDEDADDYEGENDFLDNWSFGDTSYVLVNAADFIEAWWEHTAPENKDKVQAVLMKILDGGNTYVDVAG
jgi:hypothetical protein